MKKQSITKMLKITSFLLIISIITTSCSGLKNLFEIETSQSIQSTEADTQQVDSDSKDVFQSIDTSLANIKTQNDVDRSVQLFKDYVISKISFKPISTQADNNNKIKKLYSQLESIDIHQTSKLEYQIRKGKNLSSKDLISIEQLTKTINFFTKEYNVATTSEGKISFCL